MNISIINGNTNQKISDIIENSTKSICSHGSNIRVITPDTGPMTVENALDGLVSSIGVIQEIIKNQDETDAFIIGCFSDPGLFAAREITDKPVIGIAQASMVVAIQLGYRFTILSPLRRLKPVLMDLVRRYGFEANCSGVRTVEFGVSDAADHKQLVVDAFIEAGKQAIEIDGADVLILGGAVLSGTEKILSNQLGLPVLDPIKCAIGQAETIVNMRLKTSKTNGFSYPQKKECKNCSDTLKSFYESL
jgi:allantoin racemase